MIGVIITSLADPFLADVVSTVEDTASLRGYSVIVANSKSDADREIRVVDTFEERRVDGVLIMASNIQASQFPLFTGKQVPIVLMNSQIRGETGYSVTIDNTVAAQGAVRFLIQLGHRRIAYIGDRFGLQVNEAREAGYRAALENAGLVCDPEMMVRGDSTPESGTAAIEELLSLPEPPTAVFCYNDMTAIGALSAAAARKVNVPGDLSIVGFDDLPISSYTIPALTTVRQPRQQMGQIATDTLLNIVNGSTSERSRKLGAELIVRDSTAPPRSSSR